jgi:hypothetical protein
LLVNLKYYYLFYTKNFKIYIYLIWNYINLYNFIFYIYWYKFLVLLIK